MAQETFRLLAKAFEIDVNEPPTARRALLVRAGGGGHRPRSPCSRDQERAGRPTHSAFITPNNWKLIQDKFGWKAIGDVDRDLKDMLTT